LGDKLINAVFIAFVNMGVFVLKNNGLVFNVFIAIVQSNTNTYRPPHVYPREGVGRVVSNNTINNIYIYIYYKNKGFGMGELVQSLPLQLICIKCN